MTRKTPVTVAASVRARLLKVSKERREDFTLTLMNDAAERFLYRLARSKYRDRFVLKGAMLCAVRVGEQYRPTRDLDLLGLGEAFEVAVATAVRDIATTKVDDDGLVFDVDRLEVQAIREDNAYGGIRAVMQARLAEARIRPDRCRLRGCDYSDGNGPRFPDAPRGGRDDPSGDRVRGSRPGRRPPRRQR